MELAFSACDCFGEGPIREIVVKFIILALIVLLAVLELLQINITAWELVIKIIAIMLVVGIVVVEFRKLRPRLCHAFIYRNKETGAIVYCENDQGDDTRDFHKLGDGQIPCDQVGECFFVK